MDESRVKVAIQETLDAVLPQLVSQVCEKLNKEKFKKWKDLTVSDLDQLIDERTIESFCRAAAHPSLTQEQIKRLVGITLSSPSIEKQKIVFKKLVKTHELGTEIKEKIRGAGVETYNYNNLAYCFVVLDTSHSKKCRQKARRKIFEALYYFDYPCSRTGQPFSEGLINELGRLSGFTPNCLHFIDVLCEENVSKLIKYTQSVTYNTRIFAQKKIEIIIKHQLRVCPNLIECLKYYDSHDRRGLSVIIRDVTSEREINQ